MQRLVRRLAGALALAVIGTATALAPAPAFAAYYVTCTSEEAA
ncbi:MAG TPA: hypothetical protein VHO27_06665 [Angustibacter sp.]|nr:hypothetical protein [Angustibacter sp.]